MELVVNNDEQMRADNIAASARSGRANAADFDTAELRAGPTLGQGLYLIVSGPAPKQGANIRLLPVLGDTLPEYQQIEIAWEARAARVGWQALVARVARTAHAARTSHAVRRAREGVQEEHERARWHAQSQREDSPSAAHTASRVASFIDGSYATLQMLSGVT